MLSISHVPSIKISLNLKRGDTVRVKTVLNDKVLLKYDFEIDPFEEKEINSFIKRQCALPDSLERGDRREVLVYKNAILLFSFVLTVDEFNALETSFKYYDYNFYPSMGIPF